MEFKRKTFFEKSEEIEVRKTLRAVKRNDTSKNCASTVERTRVKLSRINFDVKMSDELKY